MLGFNKCVIPFQRASQKLPFNVAGLDTVKYTDNNLERLAASAIDQGILETHQDASPQIPLDQGLSVFLLTKKALVTPLNNEGERNISQMGQPLGFSLLNDFSAMNYMYFGNFTSLRSEVVAWRVRLLMEILDGRRATLDTRVQVGIATKDQAYLLEKFFVSLQVWVVVTSNEDKNKVETALGSTSYSVEIFSIDDVNAELESLSTPTEGTT